MCMQLSAQVGPSELEEFFQKVGQVKEVKMIADKNSRRSKGIAYVEFHDEKSIPGVSQIYTLYARIFTNSPSDLVSQYCFPQPFLQI